MLSKSQARLFFLGGTLVFSCVFLYLTVDSIGKVPEQTRSRNITAEVKRGKHLFDKNNCMGCHTILGEGAYYAPELTKVYERRGPEWMAVFLKDPEAMYPNQRKMVNYHLKPEEISDLIAFFKWIGEMDLNGFPPKPDIQANPTSSNGSAAKSAQSATQAIPAKYTALCTACHQLGGQGGNVGPTLDGVGSRRDVAWIDTWLKDPNAVKPGTAMPQMPLSELERQELASFLAAQK
jgi:nitric oxide reductase subunit C